MKIRSLKVPAIIIAIGLIAAIAASLLTGMVKEPAITEYDFPYTVTYTLDGETRTFEGVYKCRFLFTGKGTDPLERYYEGTYLTTTSEYHPAAYTVAEKDGLELCIVTVFSNKYLMGDTKGVPEGTFRYDPYLAVMDREGMEYTEEEYLGKFDAELISWELPEPVENSFVFTGFSHLHDSSMIAMLTVGALVIIACMIFVKRNRATPRKALNIVSCILNVIIAAVFIPFVTVIALWSQIFLSGSEWTYQVELCIPALTAFSIAASLSLRRNGFLKTGFFIPFAGPVLFAVLMFL